MKPIACTLFFILAIVSNTYAQSPRKLLSITGMGGNDVDGPALNKVLTTPDGGYIVSLQSWSYFGNISLGCVPTSIVGCVIRKYKSDGSFEWDKCRNCFDYAPFAFQSPSGYITYVGSGRYADPNSQLNIEKTLPNGSWVWRRKYGGSSRDAASDVLQEADGGLAILGYTSSVDGDIVMPPGDSVKKADNIWLVRTDSNGLIKWQKIIGGSKYDRGVSIARAPHGGYYILGNSNSPDYDCGCTPPDSRFSDIYIARLDSLGDIMWSRCMGGSDGMVSAVTIIEDGSGGLFAAANVRTGGRDLSGIYLGNGDLWLIRLDSSNRLLLNKCYGSSSNAEWVSGIALGKDSTLWIAARSNGQGGMVDTAFGESDAWVINTDMAGNILYTKVLGGRKSETAAAIHQLKDSSIVVVGSYDGPAEPGSEFLKTYLGGKADAFSAHIGIPTFNKLETAVKLGNDITIYPNPAEDIVHITSNSDIQQNMSITDATGRMCYSGNLKPGKSSIDVSKFPTGVYLCVVSNGNAIYRTRFLKL